MFLSSQNDAVPITQTDARHKRSKDAHKGLKSTYTFFLKLNIKD